MMMNNSITAVHGRVIVIVRQMERILLNLKIGYAGLFTNAYKIENAYEVRLYNSIDY